MNKILLVDGNALVHRSFHAIPPLTAPDGTLVNAVYGFFSTLLSAITKLEPKYCLVAFDVSGGTFRDDLFKEYKAKRVKAPDSLYAQFPLIHHLLDSFEIPHIGIKGFEADDVIGTLCRKVQSSEFIVHSEDKNNSKTINHEPLTMHSQPAGLETIIVTGDQDAIQLINETTKVFTMRHGLKDTVLMDEKAVVEKYGFTPKQMVDYKALRGDPSDNIPGVAGIGDKTACQLIKDYGSLENILAKVDELPDKLKNKIKDQIEEAKLSKTLATIRTDVPLEFNLDQATLHDFDQAKLETAFTKLGMKSLINRLPKSARKVADLPVQQTLL